MSGFDLASLEAIVATRAGALDGSSYTASLVNAGIAKAARKLGEEATEIVIAAVSEDDRALASEAADLLYHLMVVLKIRGVALQTVMDELDRRTARTGLDEKASRPKVSGR